MRLAAEIGDMCVLTTDRKKPLTDSLWGRSEAMSLFST